MAPTRPPTLLVQAERSGQTLQAAPNRARLPPREAGRIGVGTRAGQGTVPAWGSMRNWALAKRPRGAGRLAVRPRAAPVTVPAWRSMRNWSLATRPPGAVGSWVLTSGVSPW